MLRVGGMCGIVGPVASLAMVLAATTMDANFRWDRDPLSDLGVGPAAAWFNGGVILGGLLTLPLALGLRARVRRTAPNTIGFLLLVVGGISLALVGVFTEDYPGPHVAFALGYFVLVPIGLLILGAGSSDPRRRFFGIGAGLLALVSIFGLPLVLRGVGFGVPELIEALVLAAWFVGTGWDLLVASTKESPRTVASA